MSAISARLPLITASLLTVAMVGTVGWQGYRFWEQEQARQSQPASQPSKVVRSPAERAPEVDLANIDMFGRADAEAMAANQNTEDLPETNLRLFLRGVLAGTEDQPGTALVEDDRNRTEVYMIGDELPGNAELRSVHANRIVIERGGKLENLYFPETDDSRGLELAAVDNGDSQQQPSRAPQQSQSRSMGTPQATDERRQQIRQRLEELRERLRENNG
ncbi:general secretion pathway protein C [Marinobacter daqiaonensis]|uniref:General secretion pathway protein C n=1 Tax=Marinobacter daqiaonensis TaxID=650891 RepID=A0A1I6GPB0_9GAMM|nr:type II secretion system protein N [Marinobacter daqiaonensis]SFR43966.1 general secretion pathway protein C [Marinobacter daqiaonensis]